MNQLRWVGYLYLSCFLEGTNSKLEVAWMCYQEKHFSVLPPEVTSSSYHSQILRSPLQDAAVTSFNKTIFMPNKISRL